MKLSDLNKGDVVKVIGIDCDEDLKNRFYSFGIIKNSILMIEHITIGKATMKIKINNTRIALRLTEANKIKVNYEK